ncbi:MAG: acetate/propionate family kinase [Candidatus Omnitrophota bacterium]
MNILVFNCGSSSLTYKIFEVDDPDNIKTVLSGKAHRVGVRGAEGSFVENHYENRVDKEIVSVEDHKKAAGLALKYIRDKNIQIDYAGHRFVHGGSEFTRTTLIAGEVLGKLTDCVPLAPIHNPVSLSVIRQVSEFSAGTPQYVAFDSAFHSGMPYYAYTYALPKRIVEEFGFRKYGFHGLSYSYVTREASRFLGKDPDRLKILACYLGTGGASVAAIRNSRSIDTSMGYSPLQGLVMSTRCGDIDPMLTIYMMVMYGYRPDDLMGLLNKKSGLLGVSGTSSDIRDILHGISEENDQIELAFKMYIHRLKKYIGSYIAALGGVDVVIFTDDIGVHNWQVREKVCENMEWAGVVLDKKKNESVTDDKICNIKTDGSDVDILTIPTEEELVICLEGLKMLGGER